MKTKYIKVSVSERLPKETSHYYTWNDYGETAECYYIVKNEESWFVGDEIKFWLDEVPDREDEVIYVLETLQRETMLSDEGSLIVEQLLNELKQTT